MPVERAETLLPMLLKAHHTMKECNQRLSMHEDKASSSFCGMDSAPPLLSLSYDADLAIADNISHRHKASNDQQASPSAKRRASEGDIALYAAQWLASIESESDSDDSEEQKPTIPFSSATFKCNSSPDCGRLSFQYIEEYQQHLMSHCMPCRPRESSSLSSAKAHSKHISVRRVRESFKRAGTVLLNRKAPVTRRAGLPHRRVSLPVLMEDLSISDGPSKPEGPYPAN